MLQRFQAACVQWNLIVHQGAKHVEHGGHRDRTRCIEIVRQLITGAGEIDTGTALPGIDRYPNLNPCAVIQRQREFTVGEGFDCAPHTFFGIVLHEAHIASHGFTAVLFDHMLEFLHTFFIGGNLRAQIGQVLRWVARRMRAAPENIEQSGFAQRSRLDQLEIVDQDAFLIDGGRERRHRARGDAADVGVMPARRHEKNRRRRSPEIPE